MSKRFHFLSRSLLAGCVMLGFVAGGCKKSSPPPEATADDESAVTQGEKRGHKNPCESANPEAHIAKMQKCQSEATAACNTQIYGTATPTKDAICGDKDKMKAVWKCTKEKYGDDKDRRRADRQKMKECMGGAGGAGQDEPTKTDAPQPPVT
jgi:hypothetical protein